MDMEWEEVEALISAPGAEVIGKGAFGKVFRTTRNGAPVAVKVRLPLLWHHARRGPSAANTLELRSQPPREAQIKTTRGP